MAPYRRELIGGIGAVGTTTALGASGVVGAGDPLGSLGVARDEADEDDEAGPARVRVAHAAPDAPNVDVVLDGETVLSDVPFRAVSDYLSLPAGDYEVLISAAGDPDTVAFEGEITVEAGTDYTVAAIGELSEDTFRPKVLVDRNRTLPDSIAEVRVLHAAPDAPAVDVTAGHFTLADGVSFGHVGHYQIVIAGETTVKVRPDSRFEDAEPVFETALPLEGGKTYTVIAEGYLSPADEPTDEPFGLVPAVGGPRPDPARLRVAHAAPDAPNVDVVLDGSKVLSDVPFGAISDYLQVVAGTYTAAITPAGDPDTVAFEGEIALEAGSAYTVAAIGELSAETFRPKILVDDGEVDRGEVGVRVLHAAPDAPAVDVTVNDAGTTLVDGLSFGSATEYVTVDPGRYVLEVRPDSEGNDNPFDAEFEVQFRPGRRYTAIAIGYFDVDDEPADEPFRLAGAVDAGHGG